jgi:hypothetical protein
MKRLLVIAALALLAVFPAFAEEKKLPDLQSGQVVLEWRDFKLILDEIMKGAVDAQVAPEPPAEFAIRAAVFSVEMGDGFARVKAGYGVDTFVENKWVVVPIGSPEGGVGEVFIDGRPAAVAMIDGLIKALIEGKGAHSIEATYTAAAGNNPGPNSFAVPVASVPGAIIGLTAPGKLTDITIDGAVITDKSNAGGRWSIRAAARSLDRLQVSYSVPAPEAAVSPED